MTKGFDRAKQLGVAVHSDEMVSPFGEERWIIGHRHGFRPCPWAYQVARFCRFRPGDKVADLGCGAGALMVAAHALCPDLEKLVGVELDGEVADQSRRTLAMNNCVHGMVVRADIRSIPLRPEFDIVMMNPPFYPPHWGRQSTDERRARATHALHGGIDDFVHAGRHILKPGGQLVVIYDSGRLTELMLACARWGMVVQAMRFLDDDRQRPSRVIVTALMQGIGVTVDRLSFDAQGGLTWLT